MESYSSCDVSVVFTVGALCLTLTTLASVVFLRFSVFMKLSSVVVDYSDTINKALFLQHFCFGYDTNALIRYIEMVILLMSSI